MIESLANTIWSDIIQVAAFLIPVIIAFLYAIKDFKHEKGLTKTGYFIIALLSISIIAGIVSILVNKKESEQETGKITGVTNKISGEIGLSKKELIDSINSLQKSNNKLRNELTKNLLHFGSFLRGANLKDIEIDLYKTSSDLAMFQIFNKSDLPWIDGKVQFINYKVCHDCKPILNSDTVYIDGNCLKKGIYELAQETFNPKTLTHTQNIEISNQDLYYQIGMSNSFSQVVRFCVFRRGKKNKFIQSYRTYRYDGGKLTLIDKGKNPLKISEKFWNEYFFIDKYFYIENLK